MAYVGGDLKDHLVLTPPPRHLKMCLTDTGMKTEIVKKEPLQNPGDEGETLVFDVPSLPVEAAGFERNKS